MLIGENLGYPKGGQISNILEVGTPASIELCILPKRYIY